jgi:hypothetical protein
MKINYEHSLLQPVGEGPHIYISGDDDPDSPDLRLSFVTEHGTVWHDMTPKRMAQLRDLIVEALQDCDQCEHWEGYGEVASVDSPKHVCGLTGYNPMIDPPCPACVTCRDNAASKT